MLHSRVLGEQSQVKEELEEQRRDNAQLVREHNHLKQSCEELRRLHTEDQKEVADLRLQQQQVLLPPHPPPPSLSTSVRLWLHV